MILRSRPSTPRNPTEGKGQARAQHHTKLPQRGAATCLGHTALALESELHTKPSRFKWPPGRDTDLGP